jgi:hypothetical protein
MHLAIFGEEQEKVTMIDYKTDPKWNLDMARKNARRAHGYLRQAAKEDELQEVIREAWALEQKIEELISELGDETDE